MNNLGITISFIIGGLLIISILTLNGRVIQNSGETVLNMTAKGTVENIAQIMRRDLQRLGYNMNSSTTDTIQFANSQKIVFWADVDSILSSKAEQITWQLTGDSVTTTSNPNDFKLIRVGPINATTTGTSEFPVTNFSLTYFDKNRNAISNPNSNKSKIRSISVQLETESPEQYGDNGFSRSLWEKTFSPPNLKLQDIDW